MIRFTGNLNALRFEKEGSRVVVVIEDHPDHGRDMAFTLDADESRRLRRWLQNNPTRFIHNPICETAETSPRHTLTT